LFDLPRTLGHCGAGAGYMTPTLFICGMLAKHIHLFLVCLLLLFYYKPAVGVVATSHQGFTYHDCDVVWPFWVFAF
jgi:hypothetical protein